MAPLLYVLGCFLLVSVSLIIGDNSEESNVCGLAVGGDRIVGGTVADIGEFPWMVLLLYGDGSKTGCGGAVIRKKFVLTAAHCVTGSLIKKIGELTKVRLGEYDLTTNPDCNKELADEICTTASETAVKKIHSHPRYDSTKHGVNDIALVELDEPISYEEFIKPICLPNAEIVKQIVPPHNKFSVAGWGRTDTSDFSTILRKAEVTLNVTPQCGKDHICAGGRINDTCNGDSGGPLMFSTIPKGEQFPRWYVVGVTSYGSSLCGKSDIPPVYTKTTYYSEWIESIIKD